MDPTKALPKENQESHVSDIFGVSDYVAESPTAKKFLPWHKPRKQYVRREQWTNLINDLVRNHISENRPLRYLGLPGDDLLDLRYFHENVCIPNKLALKFLGFNNGANSKSKGGTPELNISLHEVNRMEYVDNSSYILSDNFCDISNDNSIAWEHSKKMGPYDVINIDLCDGFGKQPHNKLLETHYNALSRLMDSQSRNANPWLLFITTRTGPEHTDPNVFLILKDLYHKNLTQCEEFRIHSELNLQINNQETLDICTNDPKSMSDVFLIALCKWIAGLGIGQTPQSLIEVKSVLGYRIKSKIQFEDLVSFAIKITPTDKRPSHQSVLTTYSVKPLDECLIAVQILNSISDLEDVDSTLNSRQDILQMMVEESVALLAKARYDVEKYRDWVRKS